jgi:hypothetical protein
MSIAVDRVQNYYQYNDAESKFYSVSPLTSPFSVIPGEKQLKSVSMSCDLLRNLVHFSNASCLIMDAREW